MRPARAVAAAAVQLVPGVLLLLGALDPAELLLAYVVEAGLLLLVLAVVQARAGTPLGELLLTGFWPFWVWAAACGVLAARISWDGSSVAVVVATAVALGVAMCSVAGERWHTVLVGRTMWSLVVVLVCVLLGYWLADVVADPLRTVRIDPDLAPALLAVVLQALCQSFLVWLDPSTPRPGRARRGRRSAP